MVVLYFPCSCVDSVAILSVLIRLLGRGETDLRPFRVAPVDQDNVPDVLDELCLRLFTQGEDHLPACLAIGGIDAHLQEFVMIQCLFELLAHRVTESGVANGDHRLEFVTEGPQPAFLCLRQWHPIFPQGTRSIAWRAPRAADAG
jgi:hypothetical protein